MRVYVIETPVNVNVLMAIPGLRVSDVRSSDVKIVVTKLLFAQRRVPTIAMKMVCV